MDLHTTQSRLNNENQIHDYQKKNYHAKQLSNITKKKDAAIQNLNNTLLMTESN